MKYYFLLIFFFILTSISAQISICPMVGISYFPFLKTTGEFDEPNSINLTYGLYAKLPFSSNNFIESRLSYNKRNNLNWDLSSIDRTLNTTIIHNDFNLDFTFFKRVNNSFDIGIGSSFIKKINSTVEYSDDLPDTETQLYNFNNFEYGINLNLKINLPPFSFYLEYMRKINPNHNFFLDRNRVTIFFGVPISI